MIASGVAVEAAGASRRMGSSSGWAVSIAIPKLAGAAPVLSQIDRAGSEVGRRVRILACPAKGQSTSG
jgi:hypothetical protein